MMADVKRVESVINLGQREGTGTHSSYQIYARWRSLLTRIHLVFGRPTKPILDSLTPQKLKARLPVHRAHKSSKQYDQGNMARKPIGPTRSHRTIKGWETVPRCRTHIYRRAKDDPR
jgi:hypothetical protein